MSRRPIPFVDLAAQFAEERDELLAVAERTLAGGQWVGGPEVEAFEEAAATYCGARYAVALNSGTDALALGLKALGIGSGDEVITPPNSFVASTAAIVQTGARPVFADVLDDQNIDPAAIEKAIGPRTRAVMPVHLTGRMCRMDVILDIAGRHGLKVVEDAAQSIGSRYRGRRSGTFGHVGCFSAHPLKNLNALGDAGFVVADDPEVAARVRRLRNHGLVDRNTVVEWGQVSRMDSLQAAFLEARLARVDAVIEKRRRNVEVYRRLLDPANVFIPPCRPEEFNTFHTLVVQVDRRDNLKRHLASRAIGTAIHYPVPIHLQPAAATLGYKPGDFPVAERQASRILSLPIHQHLTDDDIAFVAESVNAFFRNGG
jgi:dTDP-4-amino-4,6-dideoxygalactose transaminase